MTQDVCLAQFLFLLSSLIVSCGYPFKGTGVIRSTSLLLAGQDVQLWCYGKLFKKSQLRNYDTVSRITIHIDGDVVAEFYPFQKKEKLHKSDRILEAIFHKVDTEALPYDAIDGIDRNGIQLTLKGIQCEDHMKEVKCVVSVRLKATGQSAIDLIKIEHFSVTRPMKNPILAVSSGKKDIVEGKLATFRCSFHGPLDSTIVWMENIQNYSAPVAFDYGCSDRSTAKIESRCIGNFDINCTKTFFVKINMHMKSISCRATYFNGVLNYTSDPLVVFVQPKSRVQPDRVTAVLGPSSGLVYGYQGTVIYCNGSTVYHKDSRQLVKLVLGWRGYNMPYDADIAVYDPFVAEYNRETIIFKPDWVPISWVDMGGAGESGSENSYRMAINWTIGKARCLGPGEYVCAAWYYVEKKRSIERVERMQKIDVKCGLKGLAHYIRGKDGLRKHRSELRIGTPYTASCIMQGPENSKYTLTGNGAVLNGSDIEYKPPTRLPTPENQNYKAEGCRCFSHEVEHNFSLAPGTSRYLFACSLSIPGSDVKPESLIIDVNMKDTGKPIEEAAGFIMTVVNIFIGIVFLVLAAVSATHCSKECFVNSILVISGQRNDIKINENEPILVIGGRHSMARHKSASFHIPFEAEDSDAYTGESEGHRGGDGEDILEMLMTYNGSGSSQGTSVDASLLTKSTLYTKTTNDSSSSGSSATGTTLL